MTSMVTSPYMLALAWTLVHFLWQGAAIGLVAYAALRLARGSARTRYGIATLSLAAMLVAPLVTFGWLTQHAPEVVAAGFSRPDTRGPDPARANGAIDNSVARIAGGSASAAPTQPLLKTRGALVAVVSLWLIGVVGFSVRLLGGWVVAHRFARRAIRPVTPEIHALARRIAGRLALDRVVHIVESSAVAVPMLVGWMRPVVLLPAAALAGLTPIQIEALIAHELAHVRRHDYLVNLLQAAVETLLFYHPAVWWVSRQIRKEREDCCDDLAIEVCGDRLVYVTALTELAAMTTPPRLALAATNGSLLHRVRRILGSSRNSPDAPGAWMPALFAMVLVAAVIPVALARTAEPARDPAPIVSGVRIAPALDDVALPLPANESVAVAAPIVASVAAPVTDAAASESVDDVQSDAARLELQKIDDARRAEIEADIAKLRAALRECCRAEVDQRASAEELLKTIERLKVDQADLAKAAKAGAADEAARKAKTVEDIFMVIDRLKAAVEDGVRGVNTEAKVPNLEALEKVLKAQETEIGKVNQAAQNVFKKQLVEKQLLELESLRQRGTDKQELTRAIAEVKLAAAQKATIEPSVLERFAGLPTARVAWSKEIGRLDRGQSFPNPGAGEEVRAVVTALEVEDTSTPGLRMRGVRMDLVGSGIHAQIYFEQTELKDVLAALAKQFLGCCTGQPRAAGRAALTKAPDTDWFGIHAPLMRIGHFDNAEAAGFALQFKGQSGWFPGRTGLDLAALCEQAAAALAQRELDSKGR